MAFSQGDKSYNDLPLNLASSKSHDDSRPERVRVPSIILGDTIRTEQRTSARTGNTFPVSLIETMQLRTTLDGRKWLNVSWEPLTFTFVRFATAADPNADKVEGLDHIGGQVLSIDDLQQMRAEQAPPVTYIPGMNAAQAAALAAAPAAPVVEAPPAPSAQTGLAFPDDIDAAAHAAAPVAGKVAKATA